MRALVTGAAGFIGSNLVERLLHHGHDVRGLDSFDPYYPIEVKQQNLARVRCASRYEFLPVSLATAALLPLVEDVDVVFHVAGQPGVRGSWADGFHHYVENNIAATQRLLEAVRTAGTVRRFIYSSSSSIYGNTAVYPSHERLMPQPFSPYGVTKLAGEHLCVAYAQNFGVPTVSLRYFTVYGPRQRPDMAAHRLIEAALNSTPFRMFGDGRQLRDFTFVDDVVAGNVLAATEDLEPGRVLNIAGGSQTSLVELVDIVSRLAAAPVDVRRLSDEPGDVRRTGADVSAAAELLGWSPRVDVEEGIRQQVEWHVRRQTRQAADETGSGAARS